MRRAEWHNAKRRALLAGPAVAPSAARTTRHLPLATCHSHRGMTLVELLVVIVILATLTAVAIPLLTPTTTERRIREGARELNSYISQAQTKAVASQRPYGIALERLSSDTGNTADRDVCLVVYMAEQPAPYAGFDENSRVRLSLNKLGYGAAIRGYETYGDTVLLQFVTRGDATPPDSDHLPAGWDFDLIPSNVLRPCDEIEIAGTRFKLLYSRSATDAGTGLTLLGVAGGWFAGYAGFDASGGQRPVIVAMPVNDTGQVIRPVADNLGRTADPLTGIKLTEGWIDRWLHPPRSRGGRKVAQPIGPYWSEASEYQVLRQPVITEAPPLQLPDGTAIDLQASGIVGELPFSDYAAVAASLSSSGPVFVMFSPEGAIERVQTQRLSTNMDRRQSCTVVKPLANVSLLVGRRELIPAPTLDVSVIASGTENEIEAEKQRYNWLNLDSRWVNIGMSTGSVVTTENAAIDNATLLASDVDGSHTIDATERLTQILAAQEFAREMHRIGGR